MAEDTAPRPPAVIKLTSSELRLIYRIRMLQKDRFPGIVVIAVNPLAVMVAGKVEQLEQEKDHPKLG